MSNCKYAVGSAEQKDYYVTQSDLDRYNKAANSLDREII